MTRKTIPGLRDVVDGVEYVDEIDVTTLSDEIPEAPQPLFYVTLWKNTINVYKCAKCDSFRNKDQKDEFIMHVLTHYSNEEEKEAVLDRLLKELN